jgi:hypothetical protein
MNHAQQHHLESADKPTPCDAPNHGRCLLVKAVPDDTAFLLRTSLVLVRPGVTPSDRAEPNWVGIRREGVAVVRGEEVVAMHVG